MSSRAYIRESLNAKCLNSLQCVNNVLGQAFTFRQTQIPCRSFAKQIGITPKIGIGILVICAVNRLEIPWTSGSKTFVLIELTERNIRRN